jgi:hypothetical protein
MLRRDLSRSTHRVSEEPEAAQRPLAFASGGPPVALTRGFYLGIHAVFFPAEQETVGESGVNADEYGLVDLKALIEGGDAHGRQIVADGEFLVEVSENPRFK